MNNYKTLCEAFDNTNVVKESFESGAAIGGAVGLGGMALNEWFMHWVKELKDVILTSDNPQQVKKWYDETIVSDNAIYFTRKGNLKTDYFSRPINLFAKNNDPNWKRNLLGRCNKFLTLVRVFGGVNAAFAALYGGMIGEAF